MNIDWTVVVAGVAAMIFGFIWYHPSVLGKKWMKLAKVDSKKKDGMMWRALAGALSYVVMAYVLKMIFGFAAIADLNAGLKLAAWLWLGFVGTTTLGGFLWERKSFNLWILNNVYNLLALFLMTWVLLSWV